MYEAKVALRSGGKITVKGTLNDCTAAIHEWGDRVKKAKIRRVERPAGNGGRK